MLNPAMVILEKYNNKLPMLSNVKYNAYTHRVDDIFDKKLATLSVLLIDYKPMNIRQAAAGVSLNHCEVIAFLSGKGI